MTLSPALGELLDLLRAEGFAVGVDDHLRVGKLLALETAWSEDQLRGAIRSVLAKDAQESAAFDAVWRRLFAPEQPVASRKEFLPPGVPVRRSRRPFVRRLLVGVGAGLGAGAVVAAISWQWPSGRIASPEAGVGSGSSAPVAMDESPAVVGPAGGGTTVPADATGSANEDVQHPEPVESSAASRADVDLGMLLVGGVLLAGGIAIASLRARRRRRFVPGPWRYSLRVPAATRPVLDRDDVADGAAQLTWRVDRDAGGELDIVRSAHATAATGGAPVLVYRPPPAAPRYLVLEDTEAGSERWRFLYDELLRGLAREGVAITRYTFTGDPSSCTSIDGRVRCELPDLVEHCDALIVIGDGDTAFDPLEGAQAAWLQLLHHVPRRLWLNPVPEARWSCGARVIARDTPMEHAIARGLAALQVAGMDPGKADVPSFPQVIERAPDTSLGFAALHEHLGPAGMRAFAAVAMAGAPSIAMLRWLVDRFRLPLDESTWLRVAALPWFRFGAWSEGLQARLVTWLQATDVTFADEVAKAATALLVEDEPPQGSAAHLRWELDVAALRLRAGDRTGAGAAIQKVRATALHKEIAQRISGASADRTDRSIRAFSVLGAVLCVVGGARLLIAIPDPTPDPPPSPVDEFGWLQELQRRRIRQGHPTDVKQGSCPAGMVRVPAGAFQMGSPEGKGFSDEHPQHTVTLSAYCIDKTEVTVKAYEACVLEKGCTAAEPVSQYCNGNDRPDHPINCVDWGQAAVYCKWADKRLPTEAEWEYAARGSEGREYPWGNEAPSARRLNACGTECVAMMKRDLKLDSTAMYNADDGWEATAPVGRFPAGASPFGAQDMAGNVWEWTADWYDDYAAVAVTNPLGAKTGTARVPRGGGWNKADAGLVRAANRGRNKPTDRVSNVGFRCARGD